MQKKVYVCKIVKGDQVLVCDVIGAEYAEQALQSTVMRHRRKLANAKAAASFGKPQKLENDSALYKNGNTQFGADLLSKVLERLSDTNVNICELDVLAPLVDELSLLEKALTRFSRK